MARIAILAAGSEPSTVPAMLAEFIQELLPAGRIEVVVQGRPEARRYDAVLLARGRPRAVPSVRMHSHRVRHPRLTSLRHVPHGRRRVDILWSDHPRDGTPKAPKTPSGPIAEELLAEAFRSAAGSFRSRVILADAGEGDANAGPPVAVFERLASEYPAVRAERMRADAILDDLRRSYPDHWILLLPGGVDGEEGAFVSSLLGGAELAARRELVPGEPPLFGAASRVHEERPGSMGTVLAVGLLLEHLGEWEAAELVWSGVERAFEAGVVPVALGGSSTTEEVLWWTSRQVPVLRKLPGRGSGT